MKPKIMWLDICKIWACFLVRDMDGKLDEFEDLDVLIGYGASPKLAFEDWLVEKKNEAERNS